MPQTPHRIACLALFGFTALWLGLVIGVSFIATPVKFAAPTLTLPVALDVGRVTFGLFSRIEWGLAAVLVVAALALRRSVWIMAATLNVGVVVLVQGLFLLPVLDSRIAAVIAGNPPPPSTHHALYVWLEAAKAGLLLAIASVSAWRIAASGPRPLQTSRAGVPA